MGSNRRASGLEKKASSGSRLIEDRGKVCEMDLLEIVSKRSVPGILILDLRENILFFNSVALDILAELRGNGNSSLINAIDIRILKEIFDLYNSLKKAISLRQKNLGSIIRSQFALFSTRGATYSCRGSFLCSISPAGKTFHIMILIERILKHHDADLDTFKKRYALTDRQMEIVKHLLPGRSNKEIANKMCVCEDTIKGHLKTIMKRLGVHSRIEILSKIYQL
jgi:DNA-binding CsgD family transcriptional regulator